MSAASTLQCLYDAHAAGLYHYFLSLVRKEADAKDLLQELFSKLATNPLPADVRQEKAFVFRMAHNLAMDWQRRRQTRFEVEQASGDVFHSPFEEQTDPDAREFAHRVHAALAQLPADQRTVAWLKLWDGLTFDEIAAVQGIPLNTAASRYRYALEKLRSLLRPLYEEIQPP